MKYLIKSCKVVNPLSKYHGKKVDILIDKGIIRYISKSIKDEKAKIIAGKNLHISAGWMDIGTHLGEPGYEHRETFDTLSKAAKAGGYTDIVTMPKSIPTIQTKSQIASLIAQGKQLGVDIHPLGALSHDTKGENITEYLDLHHSGAVGFTDGLKPVQKSGLLLRALQYVKHFDGLILHHANDTSLANDDLIHEGDVSIKMGMKGSPSIAEELMVYRDISLLDYAESRLCIHLLSTGAATQLVKNAKKACKSITSGVSYMNLIKSDNDLQDFDAQLKVKPILRSSKDQKELLKGVANGTIDYIASNHVPLEVEKKNLEYSYADHGAIGLETCFAALNTYASKSLSIEDMVEKLSNGPRNVLGLAPIEIAKEAEAKLTIFDPSIEWTYTKDSIESTSNNTPFIDCAFSGKVIATINGKHVYEN